MADDVKKLLLQIDASVEVLKRNLNDGAGQIERFERDASKRLTSLDRSFAGVGKGLDSLPGKFGTLRGALATIGIGLSIQQMSQFVTKSFAMASAIGETAQQLGVSAKALQIYRFIGGQVGIEQEAMDKSLAKLNKTLGEAALGADKPTKALQRFGFSLSDIRKGLSVEEVIPKLADGLSKVENSAQRAAIETLFFGKSGQQLDTMLAGGGDQIRNLAAAAEHLGIVLSDEQIKKADETADKLTELKTVLSARIAAVVIENADSITRLAESLITLVAWAGKAAAGWRNFRLELEASRLEQEVKHGDNPPDPAWGVGTWPKLSPSEKMAKLERLQDIRGEQLAIARGQDPSSSGGSSGGSSGATARGIWDFKTGRLVGPNGKPLTRPLAAPDLDGLLDGGGGGGASDKRTDKQVYEDFKRELEKEGFSFSADQGFRTHQRQGQIFAALGPGNAAAPGHSDHELYKALDFSANADRTKIAIAAARANVQLGPELVHGGKNGKGSVHLHQTFEKGDGHGGGEAEAARQAEEAERKRKESLRNEFETDTEMRRSRAAILQAQLDMATDYDQREQLSEKMLDVEREQQFAAIDLSVKLGERTEAQATALKHEYDIADGLKRQKLKLDAVNSKLEDEERLRETMVDIQRGLLEAQAGLAETAAERREIELRILDLAYQEERARLKRIIALGKGDEAEQEARARLAGLDEKHGLDTESVKQSTRGPMEEYLHSLPTTAAKLDEALQNVAASGLKSLNDGIVEAIMGAKSLGSVFKNVANQIIADLIRIAVQKAIVGPLAEALGNVFTGGTSFGGSFAAGGAPPVGRISLVGEKGPELFVPKVPGQIIPNHALGGGSAQRVLVSVEASEDFNVKVVHLAAGTAQAMAPQIANDAAGKALKAIFQKTLP